MQGMSCNTEKLPHSHLGVVRIDEGLMILSSSLVKEFARRSQTLQCNKIGDQTIAIWIYEMAKTIDITWFHDKRIFHTPSVSTVLDIFLSRSEICCTFLSLHGACVNETVQLHEVYMKEQKGDYKIPEIFDKCPNRTPEFDWNAFKTSNLHSVPVLCKTKPVWSIKERFAGRESLLR